MSHRGVEAGGICQQLKALDLGEQGKGLSDKRGRWQNKSVLIGGLLNFLKLKISEEIGLLDLLYKIELVHVS